MTSGESSRFVSGISIVACALLASCVMAEDSGSSSQRVSSSSYVVEQGGATVAVIDAIQGAGSVASFYHYGSPHGASANTGLEVSDQTTLGMYQDTSTGDTSLFIIHDRPQDGSGGRTRFNLHGAVGAHIAVKDDPGELMTLDAATGEGLFRWNWAPCCTDGAAVTFPSDDICVEIEPVYWNGITSWAAVDGAGRTLSANRSDPIRICRECVPVLECNAPATITPPDAPISFTATDSQGCGVVSVAGFTCSAVNGSGKVIDKSDSCEVSFSGDTLTIDDSGGVGDHIEWTIQATTASGDIVEQICSVDVVNPGHGNGNNGHGNNGDGVDSSNPGQGHGGPNGQIDPSCDGAGNCTDDEAGHGHGG